MARWPVVPADVRFWEKVDKSGDCWLWTATKDRGGYGSFCLDGRMMGAHRFAYELTCGPIPEGMEIDHTCHNRACVNPGHLRLATRKQNMENIAGAYKGSISGVRGVHWYARNRKWGAEVKDSNQRHYLGLFTSIAEAEAAVVAKRNELFTHNDADRIAS